MNTDPSQDSQDPNRRRFLKAAIATLSAVGTFILAWPLVASLVGPAYRRSRLQFSKVASLADLPLGKPVRMSYAFPMEDAFIQEQQVRDVFVIKHSDSEVTVFSPICTHLSCRYNWNGQSERFVCPCHGSVFSITGAVLAGPAPRPLDTLPYRIENGNLLVAWEYFESGIARKVQA